MKTEQLELAKEQNAFDGKAQASIFLVAASAWAFFISSSFKFAGLNWFHFLIDTRVILFAAALVLAAVTYRKRGSSVLLTRYFLVCLLAQAAFAILEPPKEIEFYQYCAYFLFLSAYTYSGSLEKWLTRYFPIAVIGLIVPLAFKDHSLFGSVGSIVYNFTTTVAMVFMSLATVRSSSKRYFVLLQNIELSNRILSMEKEKSVEMAKEVALLKEQVERDARIHAYAELAQQVHHDIRSPLEALEIAALSATELSDEKSAFLTASVERIKEIVGDLATKAKLDVSEPIPDATPITKPTPAKIDELVTGVVCEKRIQFLDHGTLSIELLVDETMRTTFARVVPSDFKRVMSNVIDNAAEAIDGSGKIAISLMRVRGFVLVTISDNGKGIPADVLPQLMNRGVSFGKPGGRGLGLFYSKSAISAWGGTIAVESKVGLGTKVSLNIPVSNRIGASDRAVSLVPACP